MKSTFSSRYGHARHTDGQKKNDGSRARARRAVAAKALESDLEAGTYRINGKRTEIPFSGACITRIKNELAVLKRKGY